jgi:hypothetical protein
MVYNECIEENIHNETGFSSIVSEIKENICAQPLNYVPPQVFYKANFSKDKSNMKSYYDQNLRYPIFKLHPELPLYM